MNKIRYLCVLIIIPSYPTQSIPPDQPIFQVDQQQVQQIQQDKDDCQEELNNTKAQNSFLKGISIAIGLSTLVIGTGIGSKARTFSIQKGEPDEKTIRQKSTRTNTKS
jgi:hypothetical protein